MHLKLLTWTLEQAAVPIKRLSFNILVLFSELSYAWSPVLKFWDSYKWFGLDLSVSTFLDIIAADSLVNTFMEQEDCVMFGAFSIVNQLKCLTS